MKRLKVERQSSGFTLLELMTALGIFLLICGAAFTLLGVSQQRYQTESQVLNSFQEARLGLDQIVRDVNDSGFPPLNHFSGTPGDPSKYAFSPFAWSPSYPTACFVGTTCLSPGDSDLIIETDIDPQNNNGVEWIRYQLQNTTLYRGVTEKRDSPSPDVTANSLVPYVQNVVNGAVPIFTYYCDTPTTAANGPPKVCSSVGPDRSPANIREVGITLIVTTPVPDAQTGQARLVTLSGVGRRINPNQ